MSALKFEVHLGAGVKGRYTGWIGLICQLGIDIQETIFEMQPIQRMWMNIYVSLTFYHLHFAGIKLVSFIPTLDRIATIYTANLVRKNIVADKAA